MTDREMLELAAKAGGLKIDPSSWGEYQRSHNGMLIADGSHWNPLTDDGDALRLAVRLGITVGPESSDVVGKSLCRVSWEGRSRSLGEYGGGEPMAATRRAITRAAAEIGKAMQ